jgi:hypothetical protein
LGESISGFLGIVDSAGSFLGRLDEKLAGEWRTPIGCFIKVPLLPAVVESMDIKSTDTGG